MKKTSSKKFSISLISLLLLGIGFVIACAGGEWDESELSNFTPEAFVDSVYTPFLFDSENFYYGSHYDGDYGSKFNQHNSNEWSAYFNHQLEPADFDYWLVKAEVSTVDSALQYLQGHSSVVPASVKGASLFQFKKDKRAIAFCKYLQLAKMSEWYANKEVTYSWELKDKAPPVCPFDSAQLEHAFIKGVQGGKDIFLKERYWFQLIRFCYYMKQPEDVIKVYEKYSEQMPANTMLFRSMAYYAGAYHKMKAYGKANYYYSRVFEGCDEMKTAAHFSFHPQEERDWQETLSLCTSNKERETLWQMTGIFYDDEKRSIEEIYRLNPASDKLNILLTRAVNKYENHFNLNNEAYFHDQFNLEKSMYNDSLLNTIKNIAQAGNTNQPWLWNMAAGYMFLLDKQFDKAHQFLNRASTQLPDQPLVKAQYRLLNLFYKEESATTINAQVENGMLDDLNWLRSINDSDLPHFRHLTAFNWLRRSLSKKYKQQGELEKSECILSDKRFYAIEQQTEAMKSFLNKSPKTPFEELCAALSAISMDDILLFQSVQLTFADKIDTAIQTLKSAGGFSESQLNANPFNARIKDCHECDQGAAQKVTYTRLSFLEKLKELENNVSRKNDIYNNAVLLGNAFYNISHYGNSRVFYENSILGEYQSSPFYIDSIYRPMLIKMDRSVKYYQMALLAAKTDEQKAKAIYLLAKCERNEWYNTHLYYKTEDYSSGEDMVDIKAITQFKALQSYSNTSYYKEVIKECGYFRMYNGGR